MIAYEGSGRLSAELIDSAFLLKTGWTYQQYLDTPDEIVEKMLILMEAEVEIIKAETKNG